MTCSFHKFGEYFPGTGDIGVSTHTRCLRPCAFWLLLWLLLWLRPNHLTPFTRPLASQDIGHGEGRNYSINVPLKDGMNDESYELVFKPIIDRIMAFYDPGAVVLQCGADSLAGDRLGCFNLSLKGGAGSGGGGGGGVYFGWS